MYKILVAVDGSEHTRRVIEEAARIAATADAEVTVLTVAGELLYSTIPTYYFKEKSMESIEQSFQEEAQRVVEEAAKEFRAKGITVHTKTALGRKAADVICEMAKEGGYHMVVLGSRGLRGVKEMFLGSVSNKVAHFAPCSVVIVK